jgi:metal-sulfur cluster biosynthetic enzyme
MSRRRRERHAREAPVTEDQVWDALRGVREPEIGADIVSLGLVYGVEASAERVVVCMTMTSRRAPAAVIIDMVEEALWRPGGPVVDVDVVWEPRWGPSRISPEALTALSRPVFR